MVSCGEKFITSVFFARFVSKGGRLWGGYVWSFWGIKVENRAATLGAVAV